MATRFSGNRQEVRALNSYIALLRCAETVTAATTRHLAGYGLTVGQFGVLETLYHLGPLCQRDIGKKLLRSGGNITTVVDNLVKRRLVERHPHPEDRRYWQVDLTEAGRSLIGEVFPQHVAGVVGRLYPLSATEQDELRRLCRKLGMAEEAV